MKFQETTSFSIFKLIMGGILSQIKNYWTATRNFTSIPTTMQENHHEEMKCEKESKHSEENLFETLNNVHLDFSQASAKSMEVLREHGIVDEKGIIENGNIVMFTAVEFNCKNAKNTPTVANMLHVENDEDKKNKNRCVLVKPTLFGYNLYDTFCSSYVSQNKWKMGYDTYSLSKMIEKADYICNVLENYANNSENEEDKQNAYVVVDNIRNYITSLKREFTIFEEKFGMEINIDRLPKFDDYRSFQARYFGNDYYERTDNGAKEKFYNTLFGANDNVNNYLIDKGNNHAHNCRAFTNAVCNFIKSVPRFCPSGTPCDVVAFATMIVKLKYPNISANDPNDFVEILRRFDNMFVNGEIENLKQVRTAMFDCESDDVTVMWFIREFMPWIQIIALAADEEVAAKIKEQFPNAEVYIHPEQSNRDKQRMAFGLP